jgi:hypothetical protein
LLDFVGQPIRPSGPISYRTADGNFRSALGHQQLAERAGASVSNHAGEGDTHPLGVGGNAQFVPPNNATQ